jgi:hypothetical protein
MFKSQWTLLVLMAVGSAAALLCYVRLRDWVADAAEDRAATENFGKEEEAIKFAKAAFGRHRGEVPDFEGPLFASQVRMRGGYLPGEGTKARLDRKSGHWIVTYNKWALENGLAIPFDETVVVKYQPSEDSWKEVWWHHYTHRFYPVPGRNMLRGVGGVPYPAKRYKGRTLKEWADDLEDVDLDVIDRSRRSVQAFGDDGMPYLIVQAGKHPPGSEQRGLIAAFIRVPAGGLWREIAIDFLQIEMLKDPAQATRDAARNALKQAGLQ